MDVPVTEDQIRSLAYQWWEEAGDADGRSGVVLTPGETRAGDDPAISK